MLLLVTTFITLPPCFLLKHDMGSSSKWTRCTTGLSFSLSWCSTRQGTLESCRSLRGPGADVVPRASDRLCVTKAFGPKRLDQIIGVWWVELNLARCPAWNSTPPQACSVLVVAVVVVVVCVCRLLLLFVVVIACRSILKAFPLTREKLMLMLEACTCTTNMKCRSIYVYNYVQSS